ncbi:hypothetical protein Pst134EA_001106 [Puccinia striiformis f. sp. tritici]|uniref:hypothetical protein n=1 Tax=Puccinia striiformis f. sp. tritici TaxID=168172 RepID=UPI002008E1FE|nr:hypothetical protein Pst134EA_001106 [Puccinia striiformis f. sp. tritici]KAH9474055.1 hypothetical protein Pst134EA_001106 [Puccinia striiformis f. sp. tritici]
MPPKRPAEEQGPINVDSGSEIEPEEASVQAESTKTNKKSWVWRYFKPSKGGSYNVCQVNKTPGGKNLCLTKLSVDTKGSTKIMITHLERLHRIYEDKTETRAIVKFLEKGKLQKKLNRDTLTAATARFFIKCNIPFRVVEDEHFHGLL